MDLNIRTSPGDRCFMDLLRPDQFGAYGGLVRAELFTPSETEGVRVKVINGESWVRIKTKQKLPIELDGPMSEEYLKRYAMHEAARWPMDFGDIYKHELSPVIVAMHNLEFSSVMLINSVKIKSWLTR